MYVSYLFIYLFGGDTENNWAEIGAPELCKSVITSGRRGAKGRGFGERGRKRL
jgi:hypothetical protein